MKMKDGSEAAASATFNTEMVEEIIAAFVASQSGTALPVDREVQWLWSPKARGPVCFVKIRPVPNVVRLRPPKQSTR